MSRLGYRPPLAGFDELRDADGELRPGWELLTHPAALAELADPVAVRTELDRLLADDGVTYRPTLAPTLIDAEDGVTAPVAEAVAWQLDPVPMVLDGREWAGLEAGLTQRAELLDAVLADLYGEQRLLAEGVLPPALVYAHQEYLRTLVGLDREAHRLFLLATDLGRDADGVWTVLGDRTEAPSGAGYAMQNRRSLSRALPSLYHHSRLRRLTPFFHQMRIALVAAAPTTVEDPRVVLLSPGTHAETAFDQASLASQLGFPLVEGNDLVVSDGRVWLRTMERLEPVDVIFRHVGARASDPLELAAGSRLGAAGLSEVVRRGNVSVVNGLGAGVLENPGLQPFWAEACRVLLSEPLRLPGVRTVWGGAEDGRRELLAGLDRLLVRPLSPQAGRGVLGAGLSTSERDELRRRIEARPHQFVGQEVLPLSSVPAAEPSGLGPQQVALRLFAIRHGTGYEVMPGALGQLAAPGSPHPTLIEPGLAGGLTKDVWIVSGEDAAGGVGEHTLGEERIFHPAGQGAVAMVPRVLDDLYWFGRYAERAEDLLRLVLATRAMAVETDLEHRPDGVVHQLLRAITHVSASYPGAVGEDLEPMTELRDIVVNRLRRGSVARSVAQLTHCGEGVRDQLSADVWIVLGGIERALVTLRLARFDSGAQLADTSERVLSGLLALSGITAENMVRDAGWQLLECGRGVERALQLVTLLRHTCVPAHRPAVEQQMIETALTAAESVVTFRRRHGGRAQVDSVLQLLVSDVSNPRSVAFQLRRVQTALTQLPGDAPGSRPQRLLADLREQTDGLELDPWRRLGDDGVREGLDQTLRDLQLQLKTLGGAIAEQYLRKPLVPQPLTAQRPAGAR